MENMNNAPFDACQQRQHDVSLGAEQPLIVVDDVELWFVQTVEWEAYEDSAIYHLGAYFQLRFTQTGEIREQAVWLGDPNKDAATETVQEALTRGWEQIAPYVEGRIRRYDDDDLTPQNCINNLTRMQTALKV